MRIKLDENLPVHLAVILTNLRHDVHTIAEEIGRASCRERV